MPVTPSLDPTYQAFSLFLERCLVHDTSLLWPEREIWTIATLELVRRRFVEGFIQGRMTFREKLEAQLSGAPADAWALLADCFYVYGLPSHTNRFRTKKGWVEWAAAHAGLQLPAEDDPLWLPLKDGFAPTGQKYNLKHAQLRLLVLMALEIKAAPNRAALVHASDAMQALLDGIIESIPLKIDRANDMRNAILYMAFPADYEPVLSSQEKEAILRHYGPALGLNLPSDRDAALREVRRALEPRLDSAARDLGRPFDFYMDAREEWRTSTAALERSLGERMLAERSIAEQAADYRTGGAARQAHKKGNGVERFRDPDVERALAALRLSKNVILYGPPGTGKTYIAQRAARSLAGGLEPYVTWVTLHPSYSYEDFVEGLRPVLGRRQGATRDRLTTDTAPEMGDERAQPAGQGTAGPAYEVRPGIFREVSERARKDPEHTYVLVIDEINRANLTKILGELVTLIEDDKRGVLTARLPYSGARFTVPPNLVLLGTMNTADRSIALLDVALRRRFAFVEIGPRPDLLDGVVIETDEAALRLDDLLACLNAAITAQLGRDYQIGHSYFMRVARANPEDRLGVLELVWNNQILPLLEEYFYTHRDRLAEVLAPFLDESQPADPWLASQTYPTPDPAAAARLFGEDLVVALSRICDGGQSLKE